MKVTLTVIFSFLFSAAMAASAQHKSVIITFPSETPDSVVQQAKDAIKANGGKITHEYNLIKGFAAEAPSVAMDAVSALGTEYPPVIEDDQIVTINQPATN
ncbi:conserved hypothetical protein [Coccidioides posadasii str. Silveira]|uniref:Inhibitor I9 domain-containing protein n=2 Tax=Coccidioides posadasii TaxID=199306 RepID=E9CRQ2_COCPS|nr:conserved hypothetical protein [Coccidioides posadasii str. Silveira]KMM63936.1 hypothetical protein CPAG_00288 [Coccidioides posadasii RMSCC 3488]